MNNRFKTCIVIWLAILSAISIATLCRSFYHEVGLGFDYMGIIVGILAALCTVLIGWQIYNVIDFSQKEKTNAAKIAEINNYLANADRTELYRSYLSHCAIADVYAHLCDGVVVKKVDFECAKNRLNALYYASTLEDWDICKLIASIANRFVEQRGTKFNSFEIEELKEILLSTKGQNFSDEFCKLLSTLHRIHGT